jgi:hypothetical protein
VNNRPLFILLAFSVWAGWAATARAITITPIYVDGGGFTWDATRRGVIQQAINDWQAVLPDNRAITVTFDFTNTSTNDLGKWQGSYALTSGTDVYPWTTGVTHTIHFNVYHFTGDNYTWWDPTPAADGDLPFAGWDALSVARHEIGHMLGFVNAFYYDNYNSPTAFDKWGTHISGTTFDPGGLNVSLASSSDLSHVNDGGATAGDLMVPILPNSIRRPISATDLNVMHLAYGYTVPTAYTLTAVAGKSAIHTGGSCSITTTIVNAGTADTLDFTGLRSTASGGTLSGSSISGGPLARAGGSASNSSQTFAASTVGAYTITPAVATATGHTLGIAAVLSAATPASVTVYSGQGEWNTPGSGDWLDFSKWTTAGGVPGIDGALSASDTAMFGQYFSSPTTVSLNGATPRLDTLKLNPYTNSLTIARGSGGTLTMQASSGYANILGYHGVNIISAPVILGSDLWVNSNPDVTINFSGGISGNHTLTVVSAISALSIQVGTLEIGGSRSAAAVPEPSTWILLATGSAGAIAGSLRRRKEQSYYSKCRG